MTINLVKVNKVRIIFLDLQTNKRKLITVNGSNYLELYERFKGLLEALENAEEVTIKHYR